MYKYKVVLAKNAEEAETIMNQMAAEGWRVASTCYWNNFKVGIVITFEKE